MDKVKLEMKSQIDEWLQREYYDKIYNFFLMKKIEHGLKIIVWHTCMLLC